MERRLTSSWRDIQLTEHFKLSEFVVSRDHPDIASRINPTADQADQFLWLCTFCLEPIRSKFGPVIITSGLRNAELNSALKGVAGSQHERGEAVDFVCPLQEMEEVYDWCRRQLRWRGELILYPGAQIHIGLPSLFVKPDQFIKES